MPHGLTTVLKLVAHKVITKLEIIVLNAQHHSSLTLLIISANHAHKDISLIQLPQDVSAQFHVRPQDLLTQQITNVNVQLTKKVPKEFGTKDLKFVIAQPTFHYGTVDIVLYAQPELSMTQMKDNVITVQKGLFEIKVVTIVPPDFEYNDKFIEWIAAHLSK
jgi:hypothetical protein